MRVRGSFYEMNLPKPNNEKMKKAYESNSPKKNQKKVSGYRLKPITTSKQYTVDMHEDTSQSQIEASSQRFDSMMTGNSKNTSRAKIKDAKMLNVYFSNMKIVHRGIERDTKNQKQKVIYKSPRDRNAP